MNADELQAIRQHIYLVGVADTDAMQQCREWFLSDAETLLDEIERLNAQIAALVEELAHMKGSDQ